MAGWYCLITRMISFPCKWTILWLLAVDAFLWLTQWLCMHALNQGWRCLPTRIWFVCRLEHFLSRASGGPALQYSTGGAKESYFDNNPVHYIFVCLTAHLAISFHSIALIPSNYFELTNFRNGWIALPVARDGCERDAAGPEEYNAGPSRSSDHGGPTHVTSTTQAATQPSTPSSTTLLPVLACMPCRRRMLGPKSIWLQEATSYYPDRSRRRRAPPAGSRLSHESPRFHFAQTTTTTHEC